MRKLIIIGLVIIFIMTGCTSQEKKTKKGNFSFTLPEGYSVASVTDENCAIVCNDEINVGGFEIVDLKKKDLVDTETKEIMLYLQNNFHNTNNIEFIASNWGDEKPIVSVNLTKIDDAGEKKYSHIFFSQGSDIYHMWFDLTSIDEDEVNTFISVIIAE